jgi:hypothetical protein
VRLPFATSAALGTLDVFLSIDTTGSFGGEIDALQRDVTMRLVPALQKRVPDLAVGVGRFEDFPTPPFGIETDRPFRLVTAVTTDLTRVGSAIASLDQPLGHGGDIPESGAEALWQIATGRGYTHAGRTYVPRFRGSTATGSGTLGGVGFRDGALHVVVHVTDAPSHTPADYEPFYPGTHSLAEAADALRELPARVIGIASGAPPRRELEELAIRTGAVVPASPEGCRTGIRGSTRMPVAGVCPLVFDVESDGTGLSTAIVDAIGDLLDAVAWREVWGEHDDGLGFVRAIAAVRADAPTGATPPGRTDRRPAGDGYEDTFTDVRSGITMYFEAVLRNETILPADYDQVFRMTIRIVGDGLTLVTHTVRVVVPRGRLDGGVRQRDAGAGEQADADPDARDGGGPDGDTDSAGAGGSPDGDTDSAGADGGGTAKAGA